LYGAEDRVVATGSIPTPARLTRLGAHEAEPRPGEPGSNAYLDAAAPGPMFVETYRKDLEFVVVVSEKVRVSLPARGVVAGAVESLFCRPSGPHGLPLPRARFVC